MGTTTKTTTTTTTTSTSTIVSSTSTSTSVTTTLSTTQRPTTTLTGQIRPRICPAGMRHFNKNCYKFVDSAKTWADAETECKGHSWKGNQGHLASLHSEEENTFVASLSNERVWLGGNDLQKEGHWTWTDGSATTYGNWFPDNPSNHGGNEHCMELYHSSEKKWNDHDCANKFKFVCKFTKDLQWSKIYGHDIDGGVFANLEEAKKKNVDDENSKLFSRLYDLESMWDDNGMFHFKLCYPERTEEDFPCNEWKQSSNPLMDSKVTGFVGIRLTWPLRSDGKPFGGLMKSTPQTNLIDDDPSWFWWNSIGTISAYPHGPGIPGPVAAGPTHIVVKKKELFVLTKSY